MHAASAAVRAQAGSRLERQELALIHSQGTPRKICEQGREGEGVLCIILQVPQIGAVKYSICIIIPWFKELLP